MSGSPGSQAVLSDFDGDGDLDAALMAFDAKPVEVHLNDGSGVFTFLPDAYPASLIDVGNGLSAGDIDGDSDPDLVSVQGFLAPSAYSLKNDGTGRFSLTSTSIDGTILAIFQKPHLTDVELDGDLDMVLPGNWFSEVPFLTRLLLNDGTGDFSDVTEAQLPSFAGSSADSADVDGDGFPELALATTVGIKLLRNSGTGTFTEDPVLPDGLASSEVAFADVQGDGVTDLLGIDGEGLVYYAGDGFGGFGMETIPGAGFDHLGLAAIDVDDDGDLDVVSGDLTVLKNVGGGQLDRRTVPRVGKPLLLEVFAEPGSPWVVAASPRTAEIPLGPAGTLLLDPEKLQLLGAGVSQADGMAALSVAIPSSASLLGARLHWQALVGATPTFTNRDTTIFTGF